MQNYSELVLDRLPFLFHQNQVNPIHNKDGESNYELHNEHNIHPKQTLD